MEKGVRLGLLAGPVRVWRLCPRRKTRQWKSVFSVVSSARTCNSRGEIGLKPLRWTLIPRYPQSRAQRISADKTFKQSITCRAQELIAKLAQLALLPIRSHCKFRPAARLTPYIERCVVSTA